jgi:hypothetical protein
VIALLLASVALSINAATWAVEKLPVAQIADVQTPSNILPNEDFAVMVTVDYSASYSTDIAVLDKATDFVLASKGLIIPAGRNVFRFQLTSPERLGVWMLLATVRVWWHEGWFANEKGATYPFEITISGPGAHTFRDVTLTPSGTATPEFTGPAWTAAIPLTALMILLSRRRNRRTENI